MTKGIRILAAAVTVIFLAGCPSLWQNQAADKTPPPEELYKQAEQQYQAKDYTAALETYQRLKSAHPDFKKMREVYEKIADASFEQGHYEKAIARYSQLIELYPSDPGVPRAKYQMAMCHFKQIKNTDLDNSMVNRALQAFQVVADDPNAGEWSKKAKEHQRECRRRLAEKELYKARTYISMGSYKAARMAAQRVLDDYPKLGLDKEADELVKSLKDK